ncbi:ribonuclease III [Thermosulfurimonas marina]|uniref:Ribonuclease 3 n=1 Tax=Thermosulfurimonas marina TaxID=2047767 RepID=A0A6H1WSD3_9BACT|nr:ribonuclease III [Thermosulfurimonas marina]QJA06080.1 ribonuclease III [Thermosulfurimonas marina]
MKELYPRLPELERRLGVRFRDPGLLVQALIHRSYAAEKKLPPGADNERLEFLGDAVLSAVITHLLFERFPEASEGELSRMRAWLVREERLARIAERLGLFEFVLVSRGEARSGGPKKASILAGALEAVIGAIYLDGGYGKVFECLRRLFARLLPQARRGMEADYRSRLQELTQALFRETPTYEVVSEKGPSHAPIFEVEVRVGERVLGRGKGRSKKEAAQEAARKALDILEKEK